MKILLINYEYPPIGGGGSKASHELAKRLAGRGHRVDVLTSRYESLSKFEVIDGVAVHREFSWRKSIHDCGLRGAISFLLVALPRLRSMINAHSYDVSIFFFGFPSGALSLYPRLRRSIPYVVALRGSDVPLYDRQSRRLIWLHRLLMPLTRSIWRQAYAVTAVSQSLSDLARESFPDVPITVIHNGVDTEVCDVTAAGTATRNKPVRINCVARLIPRKGVSDLLDAVAMLGNEQIHVNVVGEGPSLDDLRKRASDKGIADRVKFHGFLPRPSITKLNASADIFVLPTRSDAFANVVLEAMSVAMPVIATRVGGIPEAVEDGVTGLLVPPANVSDLSAAIERLVSDVDLRRSMGMAGQKRVRTDFDWDHNADAYEALLKRAAGIH